MRGSNSQSPTEVIEKVPLYLLDDPTTKSFRKPPPASKLTQRKSNNFTMDSKPTNGLLPPQDFTDPHTTILSLAHPSFASLAFLLSL